METETDRVAELEERLARLGAEVAELRTGRAGPNAPGDDAPVSRRGMLRRLAGAAAAGTAAAVGATVTRAGPAAAADPNDVVKGADNFAGDLSTSLSSTSRGATLYVRNALGASTGIPNAIFAQTSDPANIVDAIWGITQGSGAGVHGQSNTNDGVGVKAQGGRAQLLLQPKLAPGAPTSPSHARGEIYLDSLGALFVCTTGGGVATPAPTWVRIGFNPVTPLRVCDTRPGTGTPYSGAKLAAGGTRTVTLAGVAGSGVPATGANAAVFNVTVTNGADTGFLTVYPSASIRPNVSSVNWAPNETVGNYVTMKLGSNGAVDVFNGSPAPVDVIVDITGFFS
ncbi:MAG: hypothetical protein ACR2KK_14125 [Acidimicrobiales bacterium]